MNTDERRLKNKGFIGVHRCSSAANLLLLLATACDLCAQTSTATLVGTVTECGQNIQMR